jgi:hypothetical protein
MARAVPSTDTSPSARPQNQNYYYNEYHDGILEIANSLLKILTNQIVDKTIVAVLKADVK